MTRLDPLKEEPMRGNVLSRTSTKLQVIFPELYDLSEGTWRCVVRMPRRDCLLTARIG